MIGWGHPRRRFCKHTMNSTSGLSRILSDKNVRRDEHQPERMPVLFVGHGSPMNAIEDNVFSQRWRELGKELPLPSAILCISAHWCTRGTQVTAMEKPKTIHDFYGFPTELYNVQYPAPGQPSLAAETSAMIKSTRVGLDQSWGLDHGCWSILRRLYPKGDVPVYQMSLDYGQKPGRHLELAAELSALRTKGVLILGSGNIVHNLGMLDWERPDGGFEWAVEMDEKFKGLIANGDLTGLAEYEKLGKGAALAIPTPEHYLPLFYALGVKGKNENITFFNESTIMGSISMTSFIVR
jgi:4,5-DOPA dioxygenase extradiol